MAQRVQLTATVSENQIPVNVLDQALAEMFPDYSRVRVAKRMDFESARKLVNGQLCDKPKEKVLGRRAGGYYC